MHFYWYSFKYHIFMLFVIRLFFIDEGRPINFQTVVATDQSVLFTWELLDITAGATVDSYNVTFNIAGGSTGGSQLSTGPRVLIDELTPGTTYEFSVVAIFSNPPFISVAAMHGVETLANIGDLNPLVNEEPSNSTVADRIGITWTATTNLPPNRYRVMYTFIRLDGSGRSKRQDGMGSEIVNGTSFELSPVEAFSDYTFNVFGQYDVDGESVEVPATPPLTVTSADERKTLCVCACVHVVLLDVVCSLCTCTIMYVQVYVQVYKYYDFLHRCHCATQCAGRSGVPGQLGGDVGTTDVSQWNHRRV